MYSYITLLSRKKDLRHWKRPKMSLLKSLKVNVDLKLLMLLNTNNNNSGGCFRQSPFYFLPSALSSKGMRTDNKDICNNGNRLAVQSAPNIAGSRKSSAKTIT